ncbi:MAG: hypothetical protein V8R63_00805 [Thomasclavelia ramosa]
MKVVGTRWKRISLLTLCTGGTHTSPSKINYKRTLDIRRDFLSIHMMAIDFYHSYKEDIALFAEMGFKVLDYQ